MVRVCGLRPPQLTGAQSAVLGGHGKTDEVWQLVAIQPTSFKPREPCAHAPAQEVAADGALRRTKCGLDTLRVPDATHQLRGKCHRIALAGDVLLLELQLRRFLVKHLRALESIR